MDVQFEKILRCPNLLTRLDDADCPMIPDNGTDQDSHRRIGVVNNAVQHRRRDMDNYSHPEPTANGGSSLDKDSYTQLLFVALVDILCKLNEPHDRNRQKKLFERIAKTLIQTGVASPLCFSRQLHGLREHVQLAFLQMMNNARKGVQFEESHAETRPVDVDRAAQTASAISNHGNSSESVASAAVFPAVTFGNGGVEGDVVLSRYKLEFEELEQLGKGGFGSVHKVKHYLDNQFYAVKKIKLNLYKLEPCLRALREVRSLASLRHPNIVQYYSSWLEFEVADVSTIRRRSNSNTRQIQVTELSCESMTNAYLAPFKLRQCLSSPDITSGLCIVDDHDYDASLPATMDRDAGERYRRHKDKFLMAGTLVLCMQMELCTSTLRVWINQRNSGLSTLANAADFDRFHWVNKDSSKRILRQLLEAVAYIHSQGIIHRDLKPGNVFMRTEPGSHEPRILLGDFGLSCCEKRVESTFPVDGETTPLDQNVTVDLTSPGSFRHSTGMGTLAYSAPEQLRSQLYDCKVDMFSFGVIAFELYYPFFTYMERMHKIMRIREGELDDQFQRRLPLEAAVIRQLVQKKPSLRPSARRLLDEEVVFADDAQNIIALKKKLKEMEEELLRLRLNSGK